MRLKTWAEQPAQLTTPGPLPPLQKLMNRYFSQHLVPPSDGRHSFN